MAAAVGMAKDCVTSPAVVVGWTAVAAVAEGLKMEEMGLATARSPRVALRGTPGAVHMGEGLVASWTAWAAVPTKVTMAFGVAAKAVWVDEAAQVPAIDQSRAIESLQQLMCTRQSRPRRHFSTAAVDGAGQTNRARWQCAFSIASLWISGS